MSQTHEELFANLEQAFTDKDIVISEQVRKETEYWMHKLIETAKEYTPTQVTQDNDGWVTAKIPLESILVPNSSFYNSYVFAEISEPEPERMAPDSFNPYTHRITYLKETLDSEGVLEREEIFTIEFIEGTQVAPLTASEPSFRRNHPHNSVDDVLCYDVAGDLQECHSNFREIVLGSTAVNSQLKAA